MKGYTSRQEIENYLLITIDPTFYNQVNTWIGQIEKYIDKITGRNFVAEDESGGDTERIYDGDGSGKLLIDDCVSVSKVTVDDEELVEGEDYYVYPANGTPKRTIESDYAIFTKGRQNVKIEAKWGYSVDVPEDIALVATVLVSGIINFSNQSEGEVQSKTIGNYSVSYKTEKQWVDFDRVPEILKYYKKHTF
jgi:hypothetical protein